MTHIGFKLRKLSMTLECFLCGMRHDMSILYATLLNKNDGYGRSN